MDMHPASQARLFMVENLVKGKELNLSEGQKHYLINVLRLDSGLFINLFNEYSGEWLAEIMVLSKKLGIVKIRKQSRLPISEPGSWLAFSPVKKNRTDFIVEKATELGVERLIPVLTKFTISRRINKLRLFNLAKGAAEQCGRLSVPVIEESVLLEKFLQKWPRERVLFYGDETGGGISLKTWLKKECEQFDTKVGFLIGPEGGFSPEEHVFLRQAKYLNSINLGPRFLRTETAALSMLSAWHALTS